MYKLVLSHFNFYILFPTYLEELVKAIMMAMFSSPYVLLLSCCILIRWKYVKRIVRANLVNNEVLKPQLLFMLNFLFIMQ